MQRGRGVCSAAEAGTASWHRSGARRHCRVSRARASLAARIDPAPLAFRARARGAAYEAARVCIIPVNNLRRKCETKSERKSERKSESERAREKFASEFVAVWRPKDVARGDPEARFAGPTRARRRAMGVHSCMPLRACRRKKPGRSALL